MEQVHMFVRRKVKLRGKGQITIPKRIRMEDNLAENHSFVLTHNPDGSILLEPEKNKDPFDLVFEAIRLAPPINAKEAWEEVRAERNSERS